MKTKRSKGSGVGIIENMVAIALIGITLAGSSTLFVTSFQSNTASRTHSAVMSDVRSLIDNYRNSSFNSLLAKFGSNYTAITSGQTVTENSASAAARANYTTTFTAIKSNPNNLPEAVRVQVQAVQRRGVLRNATYRFETIIAQTK